MQAKKPRIKISRFEREVGLFVDSLVNEGLPTVGYDEAVRVVASLRFSNEITVEQAQLLMLEVNSVSGSRLRNQRSARRIIRMLLGILRTQGVNPFLSHQLLIVLSYLLYGKPEHNQVDWNDKSVVLPHYIPENKLADIIRDSVQRSLKDLTIRKGCNH